VQNAQTIVLIQRIIGLIGSFFGRVCCKNRRTVDVARETVRTPFQTKPAGNLSHGPWKGFIGESPCRDGFGVFTRKCLKLRYDQQWVN